MNCFVIMPFGDERLAPDHSQSSEAIYSEWIKPTVESIEIPGSAGRFLHCHRADKELAPGDIIEHIIHCLVTADIVIADLTAKNPNVFYELGVRHAVSNATILLSQGIEHIPFDIRTLRAILYDYTPSGMLRLRSQLEQAIKAILSTPDRIDNPVRAFLYRRESEKILTQKVPPGFDAVRSLVSEVASLKSELRQQLSAIGSVLAPLTAETAKTAVGPASRQVRRLEGVWRSDEAVFCIKLIKNELRIPYCYGQGDRLTSHCYNCRVVENVLLCRFQWFEYGGISGFLALRLEGDDVLKGGWCYAADLPRKMNEFAISPEMRGLVRIELRRERGAEFPKWAVRYFRRFE